MRILVVTILLVTVLIWSVQELPAALHTVTGNSMSPLILPGQRVLVNRYAYRLGTPAVDDILVFRQPDTGQLMIKRVTAIADGPGYYVTGDNRMESLDSRHFGVLRKNAIVGRVEFLGRRR